MAKKIIEKTSPKTSAKANTKTSSKAASEEKKVNIFKNIFGSVKNEIGQFIVGLVLALIAFYMLIAFISFFNTGGADYSILENVTAENMGVGNNVKNSTGAIGARMANYFINGCFGISAFFIVIFIGVTGLKLMNLEIGGYFIQTSSY